MVRSCHACATRSNFFFTPTLRSDSSPSPTIDLRQRFSLCEIFKHAHLKFTVYGRKQASKQASIHTHVHNAVTLMWGSLMLAPIKAKLLADGDLEIIKVHLLYTLRGAYVDCSTENWSEEAL